MATETPAVVVESILIHAPIAAVWAALTDPEQLPQWWGSEDGYRTTAMEADVRPGGAWRSSGTMSDGGPFAVNGIYRVVDAPHRLEFTWNYSWGTGETVVRYDLSERDGGTEVRVTHSNFVTEEDRADHARGWTVVLGWLAAYVTN
jgi:uncharacterized protein YndB with AHSA1/START domain